MTANYKGNESRRKMHARAGVGQWRAYPACQPLRKNIPDAYLTDKVLDVTCERCLASDDMTPTLIKI